MNKLWVFGEYHNIEERDRIEKEIINLSSINKIDYILTEEAGDAKATTPIEMLDLIHRQYYSISDRSYYLGLKLCIPVIGIDDWLSRKNPLPLAFKLVEEHMLDITTQYHERGNCVVIVGDTHLRKTPTKELGDISPLYTGLVKLGAIIHRSQLKEID